jgi:paraquat-inducible protein B
MPDDVKGPGSRDATRPTMQLRRRRFSPIWLVPIVAAGLAGWLGWKTLVERGPTITITFESADGIEAGRTRIMHKNVALGVVEAVDFSDDLSHVILRARMNRTAASHLTTGNRFWVVRPRLSVAGVSALNTLVSGAYIEMEPGPGEPSREFVGLEGPPLLHSTAPGRRFLLLADRLTSLSQGSPVYFRGVQVGEVEGFNLAQDNKNVEVHVFVRAPHDRLVHDQTRFWNASGLQLSASTTGFHVDTESLESLVTGGVIFDTLAPHASGEPSADGTAFRLYPDAASAQNDPYGARLSYVLRFQGSVRGLGVDAPVELEGIRIGRVSDIRLSAAEGDGAIAMPVTIEIEPDRLGVPAETPSEDMQRVTDKILETMVARGLRAQLKTGSLLTGQRLVSLDFIPDTQQAALVRGASGSEELPTVESVDLDAMTRSADQLLGKLLALPLPEVVEQLRATVASANRLVSSPEMTRSLNSLDRALANSDRLTRDANAQLGPLLRSLRESAQHADVALASVDDMMRASADLPKAIKELGNAARSMRILSDYLEQHPEALLRGKAGAGK